MDSNLQSLLSIALAKALKKLKSEDAVISIDHIDDKLKYTTKLGNNIEIDFPKPKDGKDGKDGISIKGDKGDPGLSIKGERGDRGLEGLPGKSIKGDRGLRGLQGSPGKSIKGDKGDKGQDGKDADIDSLKELLEKNIAFEIDKSGHLISIIFGKKKDLGKIKFKSIGGIGGNNTAQIPFNESLPMPEPVGGYPEGTTFENVPHNEMWRGLLYGALKPVFSAFNINLSALVLEVGEHITAGIYQATWSITSPQFLKPNSISIDYIKDNVVTNIASNLPDISPTDISIPDITSDIRKTITFKITGDSTSEGKFSKTLPVSFYDRIYVGETDLPTLNSDQVKGLRITRLADNINGEYQTEAGGYKWICYPKYMGLRYNFIDESTEIEVSMDDVKIISVTNDYGVTQDYYAYRSYYILHSALKIKVY